MLARRERIGITSSSYSGYMTLMVVCKTPDMWAAASAAKIVEVSLPCRIVVGVCPSFEKATFLAQGQFRTGGKDML